MKNNSKKLKLSLNKMRIAQLGDARSILGGASAVNCPTTTDTNGSMVLKDCKTDPTLTRTFQDAPEATL